MPVTQPGFMSRLGERWDRRADSLRDGREPFTARSATMILRSSEAVWSTLDAPGIEVLLDRNHLKTFPVPGTPESGVGHQTCTFTLGEKDLIKVTVAEVIEYDPPTRVRHKIVNSLVPMIDEQTIAEVPGGCSYAVSLGTRIPIGSGSTIGRQLQASLDDHVAKVKELVEAGQLPEAPLTKSSDS